jgi:hypothetical protein
LALLSGELQLPTGYLPDIMTWFDLPYNLSCHGTALIAGL